MVSSDDLLQRGIDAVKAGNLEDGRRFLAQALKANPNSETAWIWMSGVVETNDQRIHCLNQVIAINPQNAMALKGLRALGAIPAAPPPPAQTESFDEGQFEPEPEPSVEFEMAPPSRSLPPSPDGIPLVSHESVKGAQRHVDQILRDLTAESEAGSLDFTWVAPEDARLGRLRFYQNPLILSIIGGAIILGLVIFFVSVIGNRLDLGGSVADNAGTNETSTPIPTATNTVTPRPTRTPTPEDDPLTPEPSREVNQNVPSGNLRFGQLTPTEPYILTPHPSNPRMSDAAIAFYEGRYADAVAQVDQAIEADDLELDGYFFKGMSQALLGDLDAASETIQAGTDVDDNFAPLHAAQGYIYLQEGRIEQSRRESERAQELDPQLLLSYITLTEIALSEGDHEAALAEIAKAQETVNPYDVNLLVLETRVYLLEGRSRDAVAAGNLAYYIDPGAADVIMILARARLDMELYASAMFGLEDYIEQQDPFNAEAWTLLARAYQAQGRADAAFEAYGRALQLTEDSTEVLIGRGLLYFDLGQYDLAYADLDTAIERNEDNSEARYGRAISAFALGNYEQALEDLRVVRETSGDNPLIETLYIRMLIENEEFDEAVEIASDTLRLDLSAEERGYMYEARARAYFEEADYNNAFLDIELALAEQSTGTRHYYKALILNGLGDRTGAIFELEWVVFWDSIFGYSFIDEATAFLDELVGDQQIEDLGTATPSPTPTQTSTPTQTPNPTRTPTATP